MTRAEAQALVESGTGAWWDAAHTLVLITPRRLSRLAKGTVLRCIDGTTVTVGLDEIDDDTRGGMLAFGHDVEPQS